MALSKSNSRKELAKFEIRRLEELEGGKCSGSGSFGTVFKVKVGGVTRIAKRLHNVLIAPDIRPEDKDGIRERFNTECLLLSKLDHPCIVQFVGVHFHGLIRSDVTLVMECLHTDLDRFLDPKERPNIPLSIKLSILLDVSGGLLYLHHQLEEPLVHRDLKAENILITNDVRAKIADLGVSKLLKNYPHQAAVQTKCPGTLAYMPPEALCEDPQYGTSLDIFSFGQLALYTAIQQFPQVFSVVLDPKISSALRRRESELLRRKKWIDLLGKQHCLRRIIHECLGDDHNKRPKTRVLNNTMKTLCATHPKSLFDIASVVEDKDDGVVCTASVDQLKLEIENLTSKQSEKDKEIASLRHEKEQMVTEVREALYKSQDARKGQTSPQNELETAAEEKDRLTKCHEENISEIKSVQNKLLRMGSEVKQVTDNSETAIKSLLKEIDSLKAIFGNEIGHLQGESLRCQHEKETEIADLKLKLQEAEEKATNLEADLGKLDKEKENKHKQHAHEIAELTSNLEGKIKLVQQIEQRNEELRHQLDEAEYRHASEIAATKVNFETKRKKEDESLEQRVEKKLSQLEKASRDKFHELKIDNERLKAETDKLKKEAEEYLLITKEELEKKDETINELEVQLKSLKTQKEQEHEQERTVALLKSAYEQKQKLHETQLQNKAAEIGSLSDQLDKSRKQMLALEHEKNEQVKKLKEDIEEYESRITYHTLQMASIQSEFAELTSVYEKLQERYGQLEFEFRLKKYLSAVAASNDGWISSEEVDLELGAIAVEDGLPQVHVSGPQSDEEEEYHSLKSQNSLHQDNLTDTEKAELRRKLSEVLGQISDRDLKIKELEGQLSECRQSLISDLDKEIESAKVSSDAKEKTVPLAKVAAVKQMYVEATEKLVKAEEKHDRQLETLLEKLEDRQNQLEAIRQIPQTHPTCRSEDLVSVEQMDHETAMHEVYHLRSVVFEKEDQISSLQMQVKSFESNCAQYNAKENHSKDQSQAVKDSLPKLEPGWVKQKGDSISEAELAKAKKKICDLEVEIDIYKGEVEGEKQVIQQEVEKSRHLEHNINQLRHENVHLQEKLAGYDKMNEEVGILKASAVNMIKRFRSFLGKGEAEHPPSEKVDLECDNISKRLSDLMEELELQKIQAEVYKKDFEEERKEREEAAKNKDEEIAAMHTQFSKTVKELQSQLDKAHQDIASVQAELETSKKLLEDALTNADQDLQRAYCVREKLESELTKVKEQLERTCADKVTLEGESLAKTQQVKQYKKQVDHYKAQLQESSAKIEEYIVQLEQSKHELAHCQKDLKTHKEYKDNTTLLPQTHQHASTPPYQERVTQDGRQYNRQSDLNRSITAQAGIRAPQDQQLNYGLYHEGVGGVVSSPPSMQRTGEIGGEALDAGDHSVRPHELLQEIILPQVTYNQSQPNTYSEGEVSHPSVGGEGIPVNYPQDGRPLKPPSAATYGSTNPDSQNYGGMGMRVSDDMGPRQQGLMTPEIHNEAADVQRRLDINPEMDSWTMSPQAPFDPNLICPMCRLQYRIGEIQKYRKHVKYCQRT